MRKQLRVLTTTLVWLLTLLLGGSTAWAQLTATPNQLSGFTALVNQPSDPKDVNIESTLGGNITVYAPTGFEISKQGDVYGNMISLSGYDVRYTIKVRQQASMTAGLKSGNLLIKSYSFQTTVALSGQVNAPAPAPTPTLTATPNKLADFTAEVNEPSAPQKLTVEGKNLPKGSVVITAPKGFLLDDYADGYYTNISIPSDGGDFKRTIQVIQAASATAGLTGGDLTVEAGSAKTTVPLSGEVTAPQPPAEEKPPVQDPELTVTPDQLTGFVTTQGTPSAAKSYVLTGSNLQDGVNVYAPGGYELSLSESGAYTGSLSIVPIQGTVQKTIWIRLSGELLDAPMGSVVHRSGSGGYTVTSLAVSGQVKALPPVTIAPQNLSGFATTKGTASPEKNYTISNDNSFPVGVRLTAPAGYELSVDKVSFRSTAEFTIMENSSATVFVRIANDASVDNPGGHIEHLVLAKDGSESSYSDYAPVYVTLSGQVNAPAQVLTVAPDKLAGFVTTLGTPSAAQSYAYSSAFADHTSDTGLAPW